MSTETDAAESDERLAVLVKAYEAAQLLFGPDLTSMLRDSLGAAHDRIKSDPRSFGLDINIRPVRAAREIVAMAAVGAEEPR